MFQTKIDDARAAKFAATSGNLAYDVKSKGFEIGAGYAWDDGYVRAKYADIDVTINGQPADSETGTYLATPMGQIITLGGAHRFRDWGLTLGADLEVVLDYNKAAPGNLPLKGYEVFNAFAEYSPLEYSNLTFRAEIRNLFDRTYADRATYGQEFGTVTPLYQPGRAFLLSASAKF
ncbi:TonB-dependent receptor domain-containing protein [Elstera litoralis]|uniref:TonB-dependent receptor domain-containing protein n=1 Tax=Elstera litoralis TaxID=552518 RepID=UPI0022B74325|nr:TonB-dependent receptor [Elstera litoralis]